MARPEEKAMSMLNKWTSMKSEHDANQLNRGSSRGDRRPYLSSLCDNLQDAQYWREDIVREIGKGVGQIQNKGMAEHMVRDLNDKINKLMREKYHWNKRVKELGGPDYNRIESRHAEQEEGLSVGKRGYCYFGAARELPGVKEMFQKKASDIMKRKRDVRSHADYAYYGLDDEQDGILLAAEAAKEAEVIRPILEMRKRTKPNAIVK